MDIDEEIQLEAYYLYERSGRIEGRNQENWIEAEQIVQQRHSEEKEEDGLRRKQAESETQTGKGIRKKS